MKKNGFLEGSFIATFNLVLTKIMGMLYVIPFYAIVGSLGGALYSYAYTIYSIFLSVSNAGVPNAISKITSEYNAKGLKEAKVRTFTLGKKIIGRISIVTFLILFIFASSVAKLILGDLSGGNSIKDVAFVIRAISFAVLVIPHLSVTRGYIQGHKYIETGSKSQVVEQFVRILVIILGSFIFYKVFHASLALSVGVAVFGATIGGLCGYLYLKRKISHEKSDLDLDKELTKDNVSNKEIIKKIVVYAIPFVIIAVATNIYIFADMVFVSRTLNYLNYDAGTVEFIASAISTWGSKINMIVTSIAMGFATSLIPNIVTSFHQDKLGDVNKKLNQSIKIIYFISLPMCVGLSLLATPVWTVFYNTNAYGGKVLSALIFTSLFGNILMIVSNTLQSMNKFKLIYLATLSGLIGNIIIDFPMMILFNYLGLPPYYGAIVATYLCNILSIFIGLICLKKDHDFSYQSIVKTIFKTFIPIILMIASIIGVKYGLSLLNLSVLKKLDSIIIIAICTIVGALVYFGVSFKLKIVDDIIDRKEIDKLKRKIFKKNLPKVS